MYVFGWLLDRNVDYTIKDNEGNTAITLCQKSEPEMLEMLKKHMELHPRMAHNQEEAIEDEILEEGDEMMIKPKVMNMNKRMTIAQTLNVDGDSISNVTDDERSKRTRTMMSRSSPQVASNTSQRNTAFETEEKQRPTDFKEPSNKPVRIKLQKNKVGAVKKRLKERGEERHSRTFEQLDSRWSNTVKKEESSPVSERMNQVIFISKEGPRESIYTKEFDDDDDPDPLSKFTSPKRPVKSAPNQYSVNKLSPPTRAVPKTPPTSPTKFVLNNDQETTVSDNLVVPDKSNRPPLRHRTTLSKPQLRSQGLSEEQDILDEIYGNYLSTPPTKTLVTKGNPISPQPKFKRSPAKESVHPEPKFRRPGESIRSLVDEENAIDEDDHKQLSAKILRDAK